MSTTPTATPSTPTSALDTKSRLVAAIHGAFVADAASMGVHWIYDPRELVESVKNPSAPEFQNPPTPRYYSSKEFPGHYLSGMLSPYGEQLWFATDYCATRHAVDGPDMSAAMREWAESFGGRPDGATKEFLANAQRGKSWDACGANDNQAHCFMKAVPVACLFAGKPELLMKVEEAVRVHQNNNEAVAFGQAAAIILESVLLGGSLTDALQKCRTWAESRNGNAKVATALRRAQDEANKGTPLETLMQKLTKENLGGRSCHMPAAFIVPVYQLAKVAKLSEGDEGVVVGEDTYIQAVRDNILAAGDACSRIVFAGAVLAALIGGVPSSFVDRMHPETWRKIREASAKISYQSVRPNSMRTSF